MNVDTTVIDVDAYFEPAAEWLDEFPALKAELPDLLPDTDPRFTMDSGEMFAYFVSDDLLRNVPREQRMPIEQLVTPAMQIMFDPNRPAGGEVDVGPERAGGGRLRGGGSVPADERSRRARRVDGRGGRRVPARDLGRRVHAGPRDRRSRAGAPGARGRQHLDDRRGRRPPRPAAAGDVASLRRPRLGRRRAQPHARARQPRGPRVGGTRPGGAPPAPPPS